MNKEDLIESLRETGIVNKDNDANGIRVLLTFNDNKLISDKIKADNKLNNIQNLQSLAIVVTALCLIYTTFFYNNLDYKYFQREGYTIRYDVSNETKCFISEFEHVIEELNEISIKECK